LNTVRVATLNIWHRSDDWDARLRAIRHGVEELRPDILGLQEVLRAPFGDESFDQAAAIAEGFGYHIAYAHSARPRELPIGNAVLSKFPIEKDRICELPDLGTGEPRVALYADVRSPAGRIPVFVTHLNWKLHHGFVREAQVLALDTFVQEAIEPSHTAPILMGDFNAQPDSNEIRFLKGLCSLDGQSTYYGDAFELGGDGGRGITFARANPFAAPIHEPDRRIDYVFVGQRDGRFRAHVDRAHVAFNEPFPPGAGGVWASDHYGVIADVRFD
jgi:endonuclease/exonuclease/phosphatase family metal-dependent hydrolase